MNTLVFTFKDGTEVETTYEPPFTVKEQLGWEEEFRSSFLAIQQCVEKMGEAASAGKDVDPTFALRTSWILWFGWFRARPKVSPNFKKFCELLEDWRIEVDDSPEPDATSDTDEPTLEGGVETGGSVDPTATTEPSATAP